jgi:hypothetical protein
VSKGYFPLATLAHRSQFNALRDSEAFGALLKRARDGRERALAAFRHAGGERLLGVS